MLNIYNQTNPSDNVPMPHVGHVHITSSTLPAINNNISSLLYNICQPSNPNLWGGYTNSISMFGQTVS